MKLDTSLLSETFSQLKDNVNLFYFLAFFPLLLIFYYNVWSWVFSIYGFIILLLKDHKLRSFEEAGLFQRILGLIVMTSSFLVYYVLVLVFPGAGLYGGANYIVYLFGLFLVFFNLSALKEAIAPLFLIATAASSASIADWLKPYLSPYAEDMAYLILNILRAFGIDASIYHSYNTAIIGFKTLSGKFVLTSFVYECMGVYSVLVFSIILVVILLEDSSSRRVKLFASVVGVLGTFALNIVRVTMIYLTDYFYGVEAGATVHYIIGYTLLSVWLGLFLYVYSKRQAIQMKIQSVWMK